MSIKRDLDGIKRRLGLKKRQLVFGTGYGYTEDGDVLYGVDEGLTEAQVHKRYPAPEYHVHLVNVHVSDGNGDQAVDELGRPELVDTRGI